MRGGGFVAGSAASSLVESDLDGPASYATLALLSPASCDTTLLLPCLGALDPAAATAAIAAAATPTRPESAGVCEEDALTVADAEADAEDDAADELELDALELEAEEGEIDRTGWGCATCCSCATAPADAILWLPALRGAAGSFEFGFDAVPKTAPSRPFGCWRVRGEQEVMDEAEPTVCGAGGGVLHVSIAFAVVCGAAGCCTCCGASDWSTPVPARSVSVRLFDGEGAATGRRAGGISAGKRADRFPLKGALLLLSRSPIVPVAGPGPASRAENPVLPMFCKTRASMVLSISPGTVICVAKGSKEVAGGGAPPPTEDPDRGATLEFASSTVPSASCVPMAE